MRLKIQLTSGATKCWVAKTKRGFSKKQKKEQADFKKLETGK